MPDGPARGLRDGLPEARFAPAGAGMASPPWRGTLSGAEPAFPPAEGALAVAGFPAALRGRQGRLRLLLQGP
jgi:hypothetical protein